MLNVPDLTTTGHLLPPQATDTIRVVVAGSDPLARAGLSSILATLDDIALVDEIGFDDRTGERLRMLAPDVVVCDADLSTLAAVVRESRVLLLLDGESEAREAIAAGARGVIGRTSSPSQLDAAIRAIREGLIVLDAESGRDLRRGHDAPPLAEPFTARETEVVQLLSFGLTNKEIAQRLGITEHTVKFHVNAILGKLGAQTRTEAVMQAARRGIVAL